MNHQHSHDHSHDAGLPRPLLLGAALLVGFAVLAVAAVQLAGGPQSLTPDNQPAVAGVSLRFQDRPNGQVEVIDAGTGRALAILEPGEDAFIRVVMRGLVQERRRREIGPEEPFRLNRYVDGRLSLEDPATGRSVAVEAFGPSQVEAFTRLFPPAGASR